MIASTFVGRAALSPSMRLTRSVKRPAPERPIVPIRSGAMSSSTLSRRGIWTRALCVRATSVPFARLKVVWNL